MEYAAIAEVVAKVALKAPQLLPDVIKLLLDSKQFIQDFAKLASDYESISGTPLIPPTVKETPKV